MGFIHPEDEPQAEGMTTFIDFVLIWGDSYLSLDAHGSDYEVVSYHLVRQPRNLPNLFDVLLRHCSGLDQVLAQL